MITYLLVTPVSAQLMRGIIEAAAHHSTSHLYSAVHLYCTPVLYNVHAVATCNPGLGPIARVTNVWAVRTVSCQSRSGAAGVKT